MQQWRSEFLTGNKDEKTINEVEEAQDEALEKEEEKKKAKHRTRGPYRKHTATGKQSTDALGKDYAPL